MRKKNKSQSSYTKAQQDIITVQQWRSTNTDQGSTSRALHTSCSTLTLDRFIACYCYDNLAALIISGEFSLRELQDAWIVIYTEFIDLSYSADKKALTSLTRNIIVLEAKIMRVRCIVKYMAVQWDEEYANDLRAMNFRYKYDSSRKKEYTDDLKMVLSRMQGWEIDLAVMNDEYQSYIKKDEGEKPDEIYFIQTLTRLAKWQGGGRLAANEVSATEYLMIKNDYHEYADELKRQKDAKR